MNLDRIAERCKAADRVIERMDQRESDNASQRGGCPYVGAGALPPARKAAPVFTGTCIEDIIRTVERIQGDIPQPADDGYPEDWWDDRISDVNPAVERFRDQEVKP